MIVEIKILLVCGDVISLVTGLLHYNARQFITLLNVYGDVSLWVHLIHKIHWSPSNNDDSTKVVLFLYTLPWSYVDTRCRCYHYNHLFHFDFSASAIENWRNILRCTLLDGKKLYIFIFREKITTKLLWSMISVFFIQDILERKFSSFLLCSSRWQGIPKFF